MGSPNTWVSAPHDGRFYLFDTETGTRAEDFNPGPHAAQYFGHSVECSRQGFFVVAEDGNGGHGSKAAFTFYKKPSLGQTNSPLLRDVIGANAPGYAISWSTVGVGGLVAAAPYRRASETGWTLQSWRATTGPDGEVKSVARAAHATGFPLMQGDQPRACSQCKTNGARIALSQPATEGGRVLLFDCSTPDALTYISAVEAPEDAGRDFAYSIAFAGDVLCIGAPNAPTQGGGHGAVYLLDTKRLKGKPRMRRVTSDASDTNERFGLEIATGDGLMAISSGKDVVYLFSLPKRMADLAIPESPSEPQVRDSPIVGSWACKHVGATAEYALHFFASGDVHASSSPDDSNSKLVGRWSMQDGLPFVSFFEGHWDKITKLGDKDIEYRNSSGTRFTGRRIK